jgi:uncharacterized phage-like protein YoqJ
MIIAATGHRPPKLGGYGEAAASRLEALATAYLAAQRPAQAISGMALGWDQAFAVAALRLDIPLIAAVPFEGHEKRWPDKSVQRHREILAAASVVHVVSEYPGSRAMDLRNRWMVDNSDLVCAMWDGSWGGTFNCIQYVRRRGLPFDNLWKTWAYDLSDLLR